MAKSVFGKIVKATLGVTAVVGAAAAAGVIYGLKKWSEDDDSQEIKITTGFPTGLKVSKTEDGKYVVDTKYDWAEDPAFVDDLTEYEDDDTHGIVIDISDAARCQCGCEDTDVAEALEDVADKIADVVEDVADKVGGALDDVAEKVEDAVEDITE